MMTVGDCLSEDQLRAFHLGDLPDDAVDAAAEHLEACSHCEDALHRLEPLTDPVLSALRRPAPDGYSFLRPPEGQDEIGWLAHYRVLEVLGEGGMGVVFKAEDTHLRRVVALKVVKSSKSDDLAVRQRFLREARAMASVRSDAIVTVHQVGLDGDVPYLAMELLEGESLETAMRRGRTALPEVLRLGREIAAGLAAAHDKGLIHRDVKPGNVWLEASGRVKLLDFGLACGGSEQGHLTRDGLIVGTPAYMAPEQARGDAVDARCDLFGLGCILYRLTTGQLPFDGLNTMAVLTSLAVHEPPSIDTLDGRLPPSLGRLVSRLLAKEPADRPASAREVIAELRRIEAEVAAGNRTHAIARPRKPQPRRSRRWLLLAAAVVGAAVLIALAAASPMWMKPLGQEQDPPPAPTAISAEEATWRRDVAALKPDAQVTAVAAMLKKRNPTFDGELTPVIEGHRVTGLSFPATDVEDLSPLQALPDLASLDLTFAGGKQGNLSSLEALRGLRLRHLSFAWCSVDDLSPLEGMPLETLQFLHVPVHDLSPLKGMRLTELWCGVSRVESLEPLRGMPLRQLRANGTRIDSLVPLRGMPLELLWCGFSGVNDLGPLEGMKLKELEIEALKDLTSLKPLEGMPLRTLIAHCETGIRDWSPLVKMTELEDVSGDFQMGRDLKSLRATKSLQKINGKSADEFFRAVER